MAADLALFFNGAELAESHNISGSTKMVIIDNDRLMQRSKAEYEGISVGQLLFYIQSKDLPKRPEPNTVMSFDGKPMVVFDCREEDGMYEIILSQNR